MTDVYFCYDTEDFTSNRSSDSILLQAEILREYGIKGDFNIVGYLARELVRNKRQDVLDALKHHVISFHSLRHTYHPTICEYTDLEDYGAARAELERKEAEGAGMVKAVFGVEELPGVTPPGMSMSYVAMYTYADWDIPVYLGSFFMTSEFVYYANGIHTNYDFPLEGYLFNPDFDIPAFLDKMASKPHCLLYNHPNMVMFKEFWDMYNYNKVNMHEMHQWVEPPRRTEEETATYLRNFRRLIEAIQADDRFEISDIKTLKDKAVANIHGRAVTKDMLPGIREALEKNFHWIGSPVSLSLCDCFYAAKHFMSSDETYHPGFVHGFLQEPEGVSETVTLTAEQVKKAAAKADPAEFLPPYFDVDGIKVGPADLLFAMLDVAMGAEKVTLQPRRQQCKYEEKFPNLPTFDLKGSWLHSDDFKDEYLTDRLRLQTWTIRTEDK